MYHQSVLLHPGINALNIKDNGTYVDATFGGGGHSREILNRLKGGKLFAFDQDQSALKNSPEDDRFVLIPHNFRHMKRFLRLQGVKQVDGIFADLGVSSHQFDTAERGFSTRFEGPLDMRMNQEQELSAERLIATISADELQDILGSYGEVRNARSLAQRIVEARRLSPIKTTSDLMEIGKDLARGKTVRYWAQVFQAIRIAVNDELGALEEMLEQSKDLLPEGGRLAIISFHSLEDRMVKNFMRWGNCHRAPETDEYGHRPSWFKLISKKAIEADAEETKENPRARSAKLRVAERIKS